MRKPVVIILLLALLVPSAALARGRDKDDGTLVIKNASATIQIVAKGTIFARVDSGSIVVTDPNPADGSEPLVLGADRTRAVNDSTTIYRGKNFRVRFVDSRYRIKIVGSGVDVSAVGSGSVRIVGQGTLDDGLVSVDATAFRALTALVTVVTFGRAPGPLPLPFGG